MIDPTGKIRISDTTLRDGEQTPGVVFTLRDKLRIAELLNALGIDEVEAGTPAISPRESREIRFLSGQRFPFALSVWCRAVKADILGALKTGAGIVNISFPLSDILLQAMNHDRDYLFRLLDEILLFADKECPCYSVGLQDSGRADPRLLDRVVERIAASRAFRVRLADTVGILNPMDTARLVRRAKRRAPRVAVEFHAHNDLGMATANTVAAAAAGADYLSVTVNGIGERAGNCPLEELLFALKYSLRRRLVWNNALLLPLSQLISHLTSRPVSPDKPVTGTMVARHESGIHVNCLLRDPLSYMPYPPEAWDGKHHEFVLGKHSGASAVVNYYTGHGLPVTPQEAQILLKKIKRQAVHLKRALTDDELLKLYNDRSLS